MKKAPNSTVPWITGRSNAHDRLVGVAADARDVEDGLGEDRTAEQDADVQAEQRDDRRDRRAHAVAEDHAALGQALGPGRADVVLLQRVDQVAAQEARVDRGERRPRARTTA